VFPPTTLDPATTGLILIDFQREYFDGALPLADGEAAAARAAELARWADGRGIRVIHVHHLSPNPSSAVFRGGTTSVEPYAALVP